MPAPLKNCGQNKKKCEATAKLNIEVGYLKNKQWNERIGSFLDKFRLSYIDKTWVYDT